MKVIITSSIGMIGCSTLTECLVNGKVKEVLSQTLENWRFHIQNLKKFPDEAVLPIAKKNKIGNNQQ